MTLCRLARLVRLAAVAVVQCAMISQPVLTASLQDCRSQTAPDAIDSCTAIIENAEEPPRDRARAYFYRAVAFRNINELKQARKDIESAIGLDPSWASNHLLRCSILLTEGDADGALASCSRCIDLDPGLDLAYRLRGQIRKSKGELREAIEDFSIAIDLMPNSVATLLERADAFALSGDMSKALADCDLAIRLEPSWPAPYVRRCAVHLEHRNYDNAIADCTRAIELDSEHATAYLMRGKAYTLKGSASQAKLDYDKALQLDGSLKSQIPGAPECRKVALGTNLQRTTVATFFSFKNLGPGHVKLYSEPASDLSTDIAADPGGGTNLFLGDARYRYFIEIADPQHPSTVEICRESP